MKSFTLEKSVPIKLIFINHISKCLEISDFDVKFMMVTEADSDSTEDLAQAHYDQNVSFAKVVSFLTNVVDNSLVFDRQIMDQVVTNFSDMNNNLIILPDISDRTLSAALHCKFNSIISENTSVDKVTLTDKIENINYEYILIDDSYTELPGASEWCGEFSYWNDCWWNRNGIDTMDNNANDKEEYDNWLNIKHEQNIDQLNMQLFNDIEEYYKELLHTNKNHGGEVIEVDFEAKEKGNSWKPTLVD